MARTLEEVMADMTPERRARIKARAAELLREIEETKARRKKAKSSHAGTKKR